MVSPLKESNNGGSIPHDRACNLRRILSAATKCLMNSFLNFCEPKSIPSGFDVANELSFEPVES